MNWDREPSVWIVCMFDLPVMSKNQRRKANIFRRQLLDLGFSMIQFSVYSKYTPLLSDSRKVISLIKPIIPPQGHVRILKVTEKQYGDMINYYNNDPIQVEEVPDQLTLFDNF